MTLTAFAFVFGQTDPKQHEPETKVPALSAFHEVIYPIWHTYWPEKDYAGLRGMAAEVNEKAAGIYSLILPGFYREREAKWEENVEKFKKSVTRFNASVKGTDNQELMDAAEALHADYEMLVRTLHPMTKPVEQFHKLLYVIFHDFTPNEKWDELRKVARELKNRADTIVAAKLPKSKEAKKKAYDKAALALQTACAELVKACDAVKPDFDNAVDKVHTAYQKLESVFD